jgi:hypothetical protein
MAPHLPQMQFKPVNFATKFLKKAALTFFLEHVYTKLTPLRLTVDDVMIFVYTVDSRLSARGLTALRLKRGYVFLKKKFYLP